MTNEQLWSLARQGDHDAESSLIENLLPDIRIIAAKIKKRYSGLLLEKDDLVQEALIGSLRAIDTYDPESGSLFRTYAQTVSENAMMDYVRKCISAVPYSGVPFSLDEPPPGFGPDSEVTYAEIIPNFFSGTPEQLYIKKETITEVRNALRMISERERAYLHYRCGFVDDQPHSLAETAVHFHLSTSRAKRIEWLALDNVLLELPWW